jgi:hypothetical protein
MLLNGIDRLLLAFEAHCAYCEVSTEFFKYYLCFVILQKFNCHFKRSIAAISVRLIPPIDWTLHAGMYTYEVEVLLYMNMYIEGLTIDSTHGR